MKARLFFAGVRVELGGQVLIEGASASFAGGELHAIVGRSGAGKSVLMKAVTGLLPLVSGTVSLEEPDAALMVQAGDDEGFAKLRQSVVFVHQDPALLDELTVYENVTFALRRRRGASLEAAEPWLARLGLDEQRDLLPRQLTPGGLRRVALCRALCLQPAVLVVDEPTTGLDPVAGREVDDALAALVGAGSTLVIISHDLRSLARLKPTLWWVHEGRVAFTGPYGARLPSEPSLAPLDALLEGRPA
jgi:phospholipid/cholesterol/gamma-HCH transport system ATP-binding protein